MGRLGVQKLDVFNACDELIQKGIPVTVANVRQELGTGSYSTLLPLIGEFQTAKKSETSARALPALPVTVAEASNRFIAELWGAAARLAEERVREIEEKAKAREADLLSQIELKTEELKAAHKDIQLIETELGEVKANFEEARQAAVLIEGEAVSLRNQMKEKDREIQKLIERAARAEEALALSKKS